MAKKTEKKRSESKSSSASKARNRQRTEQEILRARREARHKRRVRSTILCWMLLIILIIGAVVGVMFAGHKISDIVAKKNQEKAEKLLQEEKEKEEAEETADSQEAEDELSEPEEYTEEDLLNDMIVNCMAEMGVEERVAGLIFAVPEDLVAEENVTKAGDKTEAALSTIPVGGIVYHRNNVENENQFSKMLIDTIDRSKYPLFLALNDEDSSLNAEALTEYGINFDIENNEENGKSVKGYPLPNEGTSGSLSVLILDGSSENIAEEMKNGLEEGTDMFYITKNINDAYGKFLDIVKEDSEVKDKVDKALENVYRIKYSGRLSE